MILTAALNLVSRQKQIESTQKVNNDSVNKIQQDYQQEINIIRQSIEQIQPDLTSNQGNELEIAIAPLQANVPPKVPDKYRRESFSNNHSMTKESLNTTEDIEKKRNHNQSKSVKNYELIVRHHARDKYTVVNSLQTVKGIYNQLKVVGSSVDLRNVVVLDQVDLMGSTITGNIVTPSQGVVVKEIGLNINVDKKILTWEEIAKQYNLK